MRTILTSILMLVCAGSAHAEPATRADKAQVLNWARNFFADPYALRSTQISDRTVVKGVPVLCVMFNAKNAYGAYTGIDDMPFEITPNGLKIVETNYKFDTATCRQPQITWHPFPELSAIR